MRSTVYVMMLLVSSFTPTALGAANTAWHLDNLGVLANERLDPIISPNAVAQHMHEIMGGSSFAAAYDYITYESSSCTTAAIQVDKSNYWMPKLFWVDSPTSMRPVGAGHRFYYFLHDAAPGIPVSPFPPGLRMVVGNPNSKSANTALFQFACHVNTKFTNDLYLDNFNFDAECLGGMRTEVFFPQCWDGINLYKSDGSHMTITLTPGYCPVSHPVKLPQIMLETTYSTSKAAPGKHLKGHLAWANGDTTGHGIHADFVNGWDVEVLHTALNTPACMPNWAVDIKTCPVLAAHYDLSAAANCKPSRGVLLEPKGGNVNNVTVTALPGCNPLWGDTPTRPTCSGTVSDPSVASFKGTDQTLKISTPFKYGTGTFPVPASGVNKWTLMTCITSIGVGGTILGNGMISYNDPKLTASSCQANCAKGGRNWAAVGMRSGQWQCQCAYEIASNGAVYPNKCTSACPGAASETCGNSGAMSVFYNPAPKVTSGNLGYYGCLSTTTLGTGGPRNLSTYYESSNTMTNEYCTATCKTKSADWAMTWRGIQCYCGMGIMPARSFIVPDSSCNTPCKGGPTEMCGASYLASLFALKGQILLPPNTTNVSQSSSTTKTIVASNTSKVSAISRASSSSKASTSLVKASSVAATTTPRASSAAAKSTSTLRSTSSSTIKPSASPPQSSTSSKSTIISRSTTATPVKSTTTIRPLTTIKPTTSLKPTSTFKSTSSSKVATTTRTVA